MRLGRCADLAGTYAGVSSGVRRAAQLHSAGGLRRQRQYAWKERAKHSKCATRRKPVVEENHLREDGALPAPVVLRDQLLDCPEQEADEVCGAVVLQLLPVVEAELAEGELGPLVTERAALERALSLEAG